MKLEIFGLIFEKRSNIKFYKKIRLVGVDFFHADRRTDGWTGLRKITAFRNFANAPKKPRKLRFQLSVV